jgi:hypothetical protein
MSGRAAVQAADPKRWIRAFAGGLTECSPQVRNHVHSVSSHLKVLVTAARLTRHLPPWLPSLQLSIISSRCHNFISRGFDILFRDHSRCFPRI